jgi:hypothetical protein
VVIIDPRSLRHPLPNLNPVPACGRSIFKMCSPKGFTVQEFGILMVVLAKHGLVLFFKFGSPFVAAFKAEVGLCSLSTLLTILVRSFHLVLLFSYLYIFIINIRIIKKD